MAGVQGPLKGPAGYGYFRSSVVVSHADSDTYFPGRSELLLYDFSFKTKIIIGLRENKECKAQTIQTILGSPAILLQFQKKKKKKNIKKI